VFFTAKKLHWVIKEAEHIGIVIKKEVEHKI
jgi:hypothetical protein